MLFHLRGKQAFNFYNRKNGRSVRLVLKPKPRVMTREEAFEYYMSSAPEALFDVKETLLPLPEQQFARHNWAYEISTNIV